MVHTFLSCFHSSLFVDICDCPRVDNMDNQNCERLVFSLSH